MLDLNPEQRELVLDLSYRLQHKIETPFHIFIENSGGSGKSQLIPALYYYCSYLINHLPISSISDDNIVLKVAPTGVAAVNVEGATIHTAFHIPITTTSTAVITRRHYYANNFNRHRQHLLAVQLLIIDEISAVSDILFSEIDNILRELHNPIQPFGGISVIIIGDLYQLPPPSGRMIYETGSICPDLWQLFTRYYLIINMRQETVPDFFNVL